MAIRILIQKQNDGVVFVAVNAKGVQIDKPAGAKTKWALSRAEFWYKDAVDAAFKASPKAGCGYHLQFMRDAWARADRDTMVARHMRLEPVGFAHLAADGTATMGDTGSTPTPGRASVLACYQAPLSRVDAGNGFVRWERLVIVTPDGKVAPQGEATAMRHGSPPSHVALLAAAKGLGWPLIHGRDVEAHDLDFCRRNEEAPFAWAIYEHGSHAVAPGPFADPARYDEGRDLDGTMRLHCVDKTFAGCRWFWWDGASLSERTVAQIDKRLRLIYYTAMAKSEVQGQRGAERYTAMRDDLTEELRRER